MINKIIADVQEKIESLNGVFKFANTLADSFSNLGSKVIDGITRSCSKVFGVGRKGEDDDYE